METLRFSLFWAAFTGGFKAIQCFLRRIRRTEDKYNSFLAGSLAGLSLLLDSNGRHTTWALWTLSRALDLVVRKGAMLGYLPQLGQHGYFILFVLLSAQIMSVWHLAKDTLPRGYHKWICDRGLIDPRMLSGMKVAQNKDKLPPYDWSSWCHSNNIPTYTDHNAPLVPCSVVHPRVPHSCNSNVFWQYLHGLKSGFPVYAAVHTFALLSFRLKHLIRDPVPTLTQYALSIFYSTNFITSFQAIFWWFFCHTRKALGRDTNLSTYSASFFAGFSLLWERASRRPELALFVVPRSLDSIWKLLKKRGYVRDIPYAPIGLFSLSMGAMMTFYQHEPEMIKATYRKAFQRYFGDN